MEERETASTSSTVKWAEEEKEHEGFENDEKKVPLLLNGKLDTKGCCFLCLKLHIFTVKPEVERAKKEVVRIREISVNQLRSVSLEGLLGHLNIKPGEVLNSAGYYSIEIKNGFKIEVDLCVNCEKLIKPISTSATLSLKKIPPIQLNYWLKRIHQKVTNASKDPELMRNYSKRMANDFVTSAQQEFIDDLRKEIANKSLIMKTPLPEVKVHLVRENYSTLEAILNASTAAKVSEADGKYCKKSRRKRLEVAQWRKFLLRDSTDERFHCIPCKKSFAGTSGASQHYLTHHRQNNNYSSRKFECDICNVALFKHPNSLQSHKRVCRYKRILQKNLPLSSTSLEKLVKAQEDEVKNEENEINLDNIKSRALLLPPWRKSIFNPKSGKFSCVVCAKEYVGPSGVREHIIRDHPEAKFKNRREEKESANKNSLKKLIAKDKNKNVSSSSFLSLANKIIEGKVNLTDEKTSPALEISAKTPTTNLTGVPQKLKSRKKSFFDRKTRKYYCIVCGKQYNGTSGVQSHFLRWHAELEGPSKEEEEKNKEGCDLLPTEADLELIGNNNPNSVNKNLPSWRKSVFNPITKKYKCVLCPREFTGPSGARNHFIRTHPESPFRRKAEEIRKKRQYELKCYNKTRLYAKIKTVLNHKTGNFCCVVCKKEFSDSSSALQHFSISHSHLKSTPNSMEKLLKMQIRGAQQLAVNKTKNNCKKVKGRSGYANFNPSTKMFACADSGCSKEFSNYAGARCHYITVHQKKIFKCEKCGFVFLHPHSLYFHKKKNCFGRSTSNLLLSSSSSEESSLLMKQEAADENAEIEILEEVQLEDKNAAGLFPSSSGPGIKSVCNKKYNCKYCNNEYRSRNSCLHHERECVKQLETIIF